MKTCKLCQVHYVVKRAHDFAKPDEGVVFCGDLNSPAQSIVHEYLSRGVVNAKRVAPWYRHSSREKEEEEFVVESYVAQVEDQLAKLTIAAKDDTMEESSPRYLMDFTLNRFTRWLRILGIDAALETEEEEKQRTRDNNMYVLFVSVSCHGVTSYCSHRMSLSLIEYYLNDAGTKGARS